MALDLTDVIAVQKTAGGPGSVRKSTVQALLNLVPSGVAFWERNGNELSPTNDGDDLAGIGDISATTATFTGAIEAESIDGGEYAV